MQHDDSTAAVRRAQELFKEYYARCFWHLKPDLVVTQELIPMIVKGLRAHGGRREFLLAAQLLEMQRE